VYCYDPLAASLLLSTWRLPNYGIHLTVELKVNDGAAFHEKPHYESSEIC
jgi:hypothetical protein